MQATSVAGCTLHLSTTLAEPSPLFSDEWLASEVWPAANELVAALEQREDWSSCIRAARLVVELGSGTGLCGLAAAALGAQRLLLTDKPTALPLLEINAASCRDHVSCKIEVRALSWKSDWIADEDCEYPHGNTLPDDADVVLASDCLNPVYGATHAADLAGTIAALLRRATPTAIALVAQTARGKCEAEAAFWIACNLQGLVILPADTTRAGEGEPALHSVSLYEVRLRR